MGVNVYDEGIYVLTEYLKYLSIRKHRYFFDTMWVTLNKFGWLTALCPLSLYTVSVIAAYCSNC